ncbi:CaiB/BaiF CoA transferase family protein [Azospirillum sp. ST 5-10]|uniref:CaiB/BaiF CoA transferase family protein n=1 Tax=unclassified Azospirillum TaxID=2630922 RepID=UPI003F49FB86
MAGALNGLKVLDLSRFIAGPHCSMVLGDLGADVVKVERPGRGDDTRILPPEVGGETLYYMVFNRNKRGITLNLRDPRGQALLRDLAARADVLVENFRPGTMERMGCGWEDLRARNPRLIMARISGYGQTGAKAQEPCFDVIAQAASGLMEITGAADGPPTMAGTYVVDYTTALYAAIGIMAAVERRHHTGEGQMLDISLIGSATSLLMTAIPEQALFGRAMTRMGNRDRYAAPAGTFRTRDGAWVHLIGGNSNHFPRLVRMLERPDLLSDPRFATGADRMRHADALEGIVAAWVARHAADEVLAAARRAEVPATRVATVADVAADPDLRAQGHIVEVEHPTAGRVPMQGIPVRLSESPAAVERPPPRLGEHTSEILGEWLGLSAAEVDGLRRADVL